MSQSATLYRISEEYFKQLEQSDNRRKFNIITISKNYTTFEGSFVGLEYVLSKRRDIVTTELIKEVFNPTKALGRQEFDKLTPEEQFSFYETGNYISYLDNETISNLNNFLETISEAEIHSKYDPKELNDNGVYPNIWHSDNSSDLAYNEQHILTDIQALKTLIKQADDENDYILVFVG